MAFCASFSMGYENFLTEIGEVQSVEQFLNSSHPPPAPRVINVCPINEQNVIVQVLY